MSSSSRIIDLLRNDRITDGFYQVDVCIVFGFSHAFLFTGVNRSCWGRCPSDPSDDRQSSACTGPPLTSVEEAEAPQVAENCGGLAAQEVEAARDVLLHGETAELADGLVATQQRGLDGHRHPQSVSQSVQQKHRQSNSSECLSKVCDAAFYFFLFTSAMATRNVSGSEEPSRLLVGLR